MRSTIIPNSLLAQKSFTDDLIKLLSLAPEQLRSLTETLESGSLEALAEDIEYAQDLRQDILPVLSFLYRHARAEKIPRDGLVAELQSIATHLRVQLSQEQVAALNGLFDSKPLLDRRDSIASARGRVLPTLDSARTTQELREVVDVGSGKSIGVIPVVTLGLDISYPNGDERSIGAELNEQMLKELSETLEKATEELRELKQRAGTSLTILEE